MQNEKNANKKRGAGGGIVATTSAVTETETIGGAGEARVVGASSGDSMAAATSVGDSIVSASSEDSTVSATSVGDSTVGDGTNSQCVLVPNVEKAIQRVQSKEEEEKKKKKKKKKKT